MGMNIEDLDEIEAAEPVGERQLSRASSNEERALESLVRIAHLPMMRRDVKRFKKQCIALATDSDVTAEQCMYSVPREGKMISGPSARLGEILLSEWGNCAAGGGTDHEDNEFIYGRGYFFDAERIVRVDRTVRRRITTREGLRYSADMIATTANAATSIAQRNATLVGIPRAYWEEVYQAVRIKVAGDSATLATRRATALEWMQKKGVDVVRVLAALNLRTIEDIDLEMLADLKAMVSTIQRGEATIDELFPAPRGKQSSSAQRGVDAVRAKLAGGDLPTVDVRADTKEGPSEPATVQLSAEDLAEAHAAAALSVAELAADVAKARRGTVSIGDDHMDEGKPVV